jgi:hypothetical protein
MVRKKYFQNIDFVGDIDLSYFLIDGGLGKNKIIENT